jgi:hypothetical protein
MRNVVQKIFVKCPTKKQVMMFSATMSDDMRLVARKLMKNVRSSHCHLLPGHPVLVSLCQSPRPWLACLRLQQPGRFASACG